MNKQIYSQGDVNIIPVELLDMDTSKFKFELDRRELAYGEVTGYAHRVTEGDVKLYIEEMVTSANVKSNISRLLLRVESERAKIQHTSVKEGREEHEAFEIPKGDYVVRIQQEADPFAKIQRMVAD